MHHACGPTAATGYSLCFNWVDSGADAPDPSDSDGNGVSDQIETVVQSYAQAFNQHVVVMGWRPPVCDAQPGEGSCTVDVYVKNISVPGYAAVDPGQSGPAQRGYLVIDSDLDGVVGSEDRTRVIRWTSAFDLNALLQAAYDVNADAWMSDATSMWAEEQVFPDNDWWLGWLEDWAKIPHVPLTSPVTAKRYGDVIWSHYLTTRFRRDVIRSVWEQSTVSGSFAPGAYDRAIKRHGGRGFAAEFVRFAATTTAWDEPENRLPNSGDINWSLRRTGAFTANYKRFAGRVNHAAYFAPSGLSDQEYETSFDLEARLPRGTVGGIALLGHHGPWRLAWKFLPRGGPGSVRVSLGRVSNIYALRWTGVIINADVRKRGWNSSRGDWAWTRDRQRISGRFSTPRCRSAERNLARLRRAYRRSRGARRRALARSVHRAELLWSLRCGPSIF